MQSQGETLPQYCFGGVQTAVLPSEHVMEQTEQTVLPGSPEEHLDSPLETTLWELALGAAFSEAGD